MIFFVATDITLPAALFALLSATVAVTIRLLDSTRSGYSGRMAVQARAPAESQFSLLDEARQAGLQVKEDGNLAEGRIDAVEVRLTMGAAQMTAYADVPSAILDVYVAPDDDPYRPDLQVGVQMLDQNLLIRSGHRERTRSLLASPEVRSELIGLLNDRAGINIQDRKLALTWTESHAGCLEPRLKRLAALTVALDRAWDHDLKALATRHGLSLRRSKQRETWSLSGTCHNVHVDVREDTSGRLNVRVRPVSRSREELRIVHVDHGRGTGIELSDPVLARTLHVAASDPVSVRALLDDDDLRKRVLAVVHGHPGAVLTQEGIEADLDKVPSDLVELVEDAIAVAEKVAAL